MNSVTLTETDCRQAPFMSDMGVTERIAPALSGSRDIAASTCSPLRPVSCTPARSPKSLSGEESGSNASTCLPSR